MTSLAQATVSVPSAVLPTPKLQWFFNFVAALTVVIWLDTMFEFVFGQPSPADAVEATNVYVLFLGIYAGSKAITAPGVDASTPQQDVRLIKGEYFLILWGATAAFILLAVKWYHHCHLPHDLWFILKSVAGIFLGGVGLKNSKEWLTGKPAPHRAAGANGNAAMDPAAADAAAEQQEKLVIDTLWNSPIGFTRAELEERTHIGRWVLVRILNNLLHRKEIVKIAEGAKDPDTRYKIKLPKR